MQNSSKISQNCWKEYKNLYNSLLKKHSNVEHRNRTFHNCRANTKPAWCKNHLKKSHGKQSLSPLARLEIDARCALQWSLPQVDTGPPFIPLSNIREQPRRSGLENILHASLWKIIYTPLIFVLGLPHISFCHQIWSPSPITLFTIKDHWIFRLL